MTDPDIPATNIYVYGRGALWTQQGEVDGHRCLTIKRCDRSLPVGAKPKDWERSYQVKDCEVVLVFETLEGARVLQDELNELVSVWAKAAAPEVDYTPFKA